jgi:hypothetical protein
LQKVLETPGSARAFREGFQTGVIAGGKALVVDTAKLIGKGAQLAGDTSHAGYAGDALRGFTGKLPEALEAVVPSHNRGVATIESIGEGIGTTAVAIAKYTTTHTPADLLADTKAFVAKNWDSLKASHSDAAAHGPQAEAKWWGEVSGRAVFEAAAAVVPVAGIASKLGKGAQLADKATNITRTAERALAYTGDDVGRVARVEKQAAAGGREAPTGPSQRPSWRTSESDVAKKIGPNYREQVSFLDGKEVKYGTKGSTRPDLYSAGNSVEVKNYKLTTGADQKRLIDNVANQAIQRSRELPNGTQQLLHIDVRGQNLSMLEASKIIEQIERASKGVLKTENITIMR